VAYYITFLRVQDQDEQLDTRTGIITDLLTDEVRLFLEKEDLTQAYLKFIRHQQWFVAA
jgi:hypothetical protein